MKQLFLNDFEVELTQDIPIPITYQIFDTQNINGRAKNLSKQSFLRGTKENLKFFSSALDLHITSIGQSNIGFDFDSTKKVNARLLSNGIKIFEGYFKLNHVEIDGKDVKIFFTLFSKDIDFFDTLSKMDLNSLDFSEYNHELTVTNISNSWTTSVMKNGVATSNFSGGLPNGFGYLYGLIDYGFNRPIENEFKAIEIIPQFYLREVIIKMFENIGVDISFPFINTPLFKKLVVGNGSGFLLTIDANEIANREVFFRVENNTILTSITPTNVNGNIHKYELVLSTNMLSSPNENVPTPIDPSLQRTSNGVLIKRTGTYKITASLLFQRSFGIGGGTILGISPEGKSFYILKINGVEVFSKDFELNVLENIEVTLFLNAGNLITVDIFHSKFTIILNYQNTPPQNRWVVLNYIQEIVDTFFHVEAISSPLQLGNTVNLNSFLPSMKLSELFTAVVKMFNLYFDFNDNGILVIEPFADFYESTANTDDWSDKVDFSKPIKIFSSDIISGKKYIFKYKEDKDYYNNLYLSETGRNYGELLIVAESPSQTKDVVFQLPFAATVNIQKPSQDLILPAIFQVENGLKKQYKGSPRLFVYNGLRNGSIKIESTNFGEYPQLSNYENIDSPTFDLHFSPVSKHYYLNNATTTDNVFNRFHATFFLESFSKIAKKVIENVILNIKDIEQLSFRKLKNINGSVYRLNKIENVDVDAASSFTAEFVRVLKADNPLLVSPITELPPDRNLGLDFGNQTSTTIFTDVNFILTNNFQIYNVTQAPSVQLGLTIPNTSIVVVNNTGNTLTVLLPNSTTFSVIPIGGSLTIYFNGTIYF